MDFGGVEGVHHPPYSPTVTTMRGSYSVPFQTNKVWSWLAPSVIDLFHWIKAPLPARLPRLSISRPPPNLQHGCLCYFSHYPDSSSLDSFEEFSFDPFNIWLSRAVFRIGGNCFPLRSALVKIPLQAFALRLYFGSAFGSSISLR